MNTEIRELNDVELENISGGMDCKTAIAVAQIYSTTAGILNALGDHVGSANFSGKAVGVLQGGCT